MMWWIAVCGENEPSRLPRACPTVIRSSALRRESRSSRSFTRHRGTDRETDTAEAEARGQRAQCRRGGRRARRQRGWSDAQSWALILLAYMGRQVKHNHNERYTHPPHDGPFSRAERSRRASPSPGRACSPAPASSSCVATKGWRGERGWRWLPGGGGCDGRGGGVTCSATCTSIVRACLAHARRGASMVREWNRQSRWYTGMHMYVHL